MAFTRRIETKDCQRSASMILSDYDKLSLNQRKREFTVLVFVLVVRVQWPILAHVSACPLALLPWKYVNMCRILETTKLPLSKR